MPDPGRLSDADQIRNLLYDYAEAIDARNLDALRELFADAVVSLTEGREWRGARAGGDPGQPVPWKPASAALHPRATKHVITNVGIEIDQAGEVASTRSYFTVLHATDTLPLQVVIAGRYHDTFRRHDAGWRFASRVYIIDLVGNAGELLDVDAGTLEKLRVALRRATAA
jgi:3-phenylpropionate/cinnamic acid dioxygenase small subunit